MTTNPPTPTPPRDDAARDDAREAYYKENLHKSEGGDLWLNSTYVSAFNAGCDAARRADQPARVVNAGVSAADAAWLNYAESQHFKATLIEQVSEVILAALLPTEAGAMQMPSAYKYVPTFTSDSTTTLNAIRAAGPCREGWEKLLKHLGKTKADDEPLDLLTILDSNGLDDALWVLSYGAPDCERLARHFQAWCAEQVLHIFEAERPDDHRVRDQIAMLRNDDATEKERDAARAAAWAAAGAAAGAAAWAAAWDAEGAAARAAEGAAARAAAWAAAWDAAGDAQELQLRKMIGGDA